MRDDVRFQVSSFCTGGQCIGVALDGESIEITDLPGRGVSIYVSRAEWAAFVAGVKAGEFDLD